MALPCFGDFAPLGLFVIVILLTADFFLHGVAMFW
jgi:hypothetical protein